MNELNNILSEQKSKLQSIKQNHEKNQSSDKHTINQLIQEKTMLSSLNESMEKTISKLKASNIGLENKVSQHAKTSNELEQEKVMLDEIVENESAKTLAISKKYYLTIAIASVVLVGVIVPYSLYTITLVGQEYQVEDLGEIKSSYIIQNLKGVTIDTWL